MTLEREAVPTTRSASFSLAGVRKAFHGTLVWYLFIIPPFLVIVFTLVILLGSAGTWIGFVWFAQKSRRRELPYDTRFSDGHFGLWVDCQAPEESRVSTLMRELGAVECRAF